MDEQTSHGPTTSRVRRQGQTMEAEERKEKQASFLAFFRVEANVTVACEKVGIDRNTVYDWRKRYKDFAKQFEDAEQEANDTIDHEIYRRGVTGWEEPMVSAGKLVCTVTKYSDAMLTLLAKSRMRKYRDKQDIELTGKDGGPVVMQRNPHLRNLSDEELDLLERMAKKAIGGEHENT